MKGNPRIPQKELPVCPQKRAQSFVPQSKRASLKIWLAAWVLQLEKGCPSNRNLFVTQKRLPVCHSKRVCTCLFLKGSLVPQFAPQTAKTDTNKSTWICLQSLMVSTESEAVTLLPIMHLTGACAAWELEQHRVLERKEWNFINFGGEFGFLRHCLWACSGGVSLLGTSGPWTVWITLWKSPHCVGTS